MALQVQQQEQKSHLGGGVASNGTWPTPVTLDLFNSKLDSSYPVELDEPHPLPFGCQRFLDLKTGEIYYKKKADSRQNIIINELETKSIMSRNGTSSTPKLDLKLNLSPPRVLININDHESEIVDESTSILLSAHRSSATSISSSPTSSCVSSELNYHVVDSHTGGGGGRIAEETTTTNTLSNMVLVGCPSCLMYVMLSSEEQYPKCPKCKSSVLLDFLRGHPTTTNNNNKTRNN